jgi:hypothetical protein
VSTAGFSDEERQVLLAVYGVGATVVARLEQLGFTSLPQLARAAISGAIAAAKARSR